MGSYILKRKIVCEERGGERPQCVSQYISFHKNKKTKKKGEETAGSQCDSKHISL